MLQADTRLSKFSLVKYLGSFLQQYSPECKNKWVVLNQGGELYENPDGQNLFKQYQYKTFPTGSDSSSQMVNLNKHTVRSALPGNGQGSSPIHLSAGKKDNLKNLRTFGCQDLACTPDIQAKRFKDKAHKDIS